ncbi:glycine betaine/L-proline ABC transporter, ATPase subunit [Desulfofarcimen acetoxidans DSM 771]|jgi:glycine betaine/proline transport system ATP-binding protein|uniref:Quaternary amine transport ATP-binding protein n=1 Tax=Desulfofarcimen acetoxidans (strain ATCC 49208 / DSM 771 / KCTC 5769 / VKM B-1644 / 5575) TaxID=485916 RepID=C8W5Y0_DESAS|nr:glycine betaine/L-proline ABC transporter ATP-binding protein [Desulfofarcimen acetoxidans]ACV61435.1 glycine betaine/L-proline ABC transporter, ATPase subunit [Desulfofarcimen acetoxidans DSM 771]
MSKIIVQDIIKIFGDHPEQALKLLKQNVSKKEILKKTKQTIGVYNVNFEVGTGEIFVLMGLSGSGKSTLLRLLNRLIEPTRGKVYIDGENVTAVDDEKLREIRRKKIGMVFQRFALFPHRTILENVAYGLEIQGMGKEERAKKARETLKLVGLSGWEDSYPGQLSGGMQQRVGLARALASDPDILLMDEAFSALDPLIRKEMQDELLSLQEQMNKTIIFVTHDLDEALKIGDRIALMNDGTIVQIGTPEEILTNPANEYVEKFVEDVDMTKVLTAEGVMKRPDVIVRLKDGPRSALRLMRENGISSIFVVGKDRKLVGLVVADDALKATQEKRDFSNIIIEDVPTVAPDTPINDLMSLVAESKYPIAVINEDRRLLGIIVRGAVLAGLVRRGGDDNVA